MGSRWDSICGRDILSLPCAGVPPCVALDGAASRKYAPRGASPVWQRVLLHSGVDPDFFGFEHLQAFQLQHLELLELRRQGLHPVVRLLKPVADAPGVPAQLQGCLRALTKEQVLAANLEWAFRALVSGVLKPAFNFPRRKHDDPRLTLVTPEDFEEAAAAVRLPVAGPWPSRGELADPVCVTYCMRHEAAKMRQLERVAEQVHARYGQAWPVNGVVAEIAVQHGLSRDAAPIVARLLRPSIKVGRRKKQP